MISNATPLIFLGKINRLDLLKKLFKQVIVPTEVKEEVLVDGKQGYLIIKTAFDNGILTVVTPKNYLQLGLGRGETAVLSLAKERKDATLLDDADAIKAAEALNVATARTTTLLFYALQRKMITKEEAITLLNRLIEEGYYIAPRYYILLLEKLRNSI